MVLAESICCNTEGLEIDSQLLFFSSGSVVYFYIVLSA